MSEEPESGKDGGGVSNKWTAKLGRFIQTYHGFLSSFILGLAGLAATSIWQFRQSQTAAAQARSDQAIARTKADNDWRIARAEILSKNLNVLSTQGPGSADQRFGVLLSLTRGAIIDPELAVSYALELGRDNPAYMRAVLEATADKNYDQLAQGFKLTCLQRFGVEKAAEICKDDALGARSDSIAQVLQDELEATTAIAAPESKGPLSILRDEREVQSFPGRMAWLFEPYLQDLYERRQLPDVQRFESFSAGARLVAALVLATARTGELVSSSEGTALDSFHAERRKWLVSYLLSKSCDPDCRGKLVDVMLSSYGEAGGDYDEALRRLLRQPHVEAAPTFGHLHARLLWCQVDADDLARFRDQVLVPAFLDALVSPEETKETKEGKDSKDSKGSKNPKEAKDSKDLKDSKNLKDGKQPDSPLIDDLAGLVALVSEPTATEVQAQESWKKMIAALSHASEKTQRAFANRRATAARERTNPPPMVRKVNFCTAAAANPSTGAETQ